ncbi:ZIP family metal transporter [Acidihalobacter sp.]|jgi:zinc transporter, ZIP family|uniref:ZIP family metal transporter n=1 Tax=Acidihalobacter sp. TaxID=1872108 RepID=UPI00307D2DC7
MLGLDDFIPHEYPHLSPRGAGCRRVSRVWLLVFTIALHNLPEGMVIGVSFSHGDMSMGLPLTTAIGVVSGLMEPLDALLGIQLASGMALAYPIGLGLAAGSMIFVVSHEVIPQTHRN